jgi:hypothetical protein
LVTVGVHEPPFLVAVHVVSTQDLYYLSSLDGNFVAVPRVKRVLGNTVLKNEK